MDTVFSGTIRQLVQFANHKDAPPVDATHATVWEHGESSAVVYERTVYGRVQCWDGAKWVHVESHYIARRMLTAANKQA